MSDNKLATTMFLLWGIIAVSMSIGALIYRVEAPTPKAKVVLQTNGLHRLPAFDETTQVGEGKKKVCTVWANFTPTAELPFRVGQHYLTECRIVTS